MTRPNRYAIRAHQHGRLGGLGMAVHAVPDAFLILHGGVGCKYKSIGDLYAHDRARPSHAIQAYTELTDADLAGGSARRIGPYLRSWHRRKEPAFMAVASVTFPEMTGEDFAAAVREAGRTVPCDTAYLPCPGFDGDLYDGYADLVLEILRRAPFGGTAPDPRRVALAGYLFDRYEPDHAANLAELARLIGTLGLEPGPVLMSGRPYRELLGAAACGTVLALPYLAPRRRELRDLLGARGHEADLPVGAAGTCRWLADLARAAGTEPAVLKRAQAGVRGRTSDALRRLRAASRRLPGKRSAVFAATPLAAGLAAFLDECGLPPLLVGLNDSSLGGKRAFREAYRRTGRTLPAGLRLLEDPPLRGLQAALAAACRGGEIGVLLGSATELRCLSGAGLPAGRTPAAVELGYPSLDYHPRGAAPYLGVSGTLHLCRRILAAAG
ncbi:MAG TPA: hypothetical protein DD417_17380 [Elusimicrobia bacterium]|nr:hypothetical protein [Elusimicrobiota bacterium]